MKQILIITLLFFSVLAAAQNQKIRYDPGFFKNRYYIGEQETTWNGILTYAKPRNVDAYLLLKKSNNQSVAALVWSVVGVAGCIMTLSQVVKDVPDRNQTLHLTGIGATGAGLGMSLLMSTLSDHNFKKGINLINK